MNVFLSLLLFLTGASMFSFIGVIVYRLPKKLNFVSGRSICPECGKLLRWYQMIPVFSYLFLRGKCGFCGKKIPIRFFFLEVFGGGCALVSFFFFAGFSHPEPIPLLRAALVFVFLSILTAIALIDADTMEIPDSLVVAIALLGIAAVFLFPETSLLSRGIGILAISLPMLLLSLAIQGAFGGGDIKLCAGCGLFLGWELQLTGFFFALVSGGIYGVYLLAAKKKGRKDHFAFGPFLCAGAALSCFFGKMILDWYLQFFKI